MAKGFQDERYRKLIAQIVEARKANCLSQSALAAKLGTHQQFVSRFETGERRLDAIELLDVCNALELPVGGLLALVSEF